jgi:hypothetical protein
MDPANFCHARCPFELRREIISRQRIQTCLHSMPSWDAAKRERPRSRCSLGTTHPDRMGRFGIESAPGGGTPHLFMQEYHSRQLILYLSQEYHSRTVSARLLSRVIFLQCTDSKRVPSAAAFDDARGMVQVMQEYHSRQFNLIIVQEYHFKGISVSWATPRRERE